MSKLFRKAVSLLRKHASHNLSCWFYKCVVKMGNGERGGGGNDN